MKLYSILLLVILVQIQAKTYNTTLFLSWLGGICKVLGPQCDLARYNQWDHQSFTIYELSIDKESIKIPKPLNKNDIYQNQYNLPMFFSSWPPQIKLHGNPNYLWEKQWNSIGNSVGQMIEQMQYSQGKEVKLQISLQTVFWPSISLYRGLNVRKLNKSSFTKRQLSRVLNISQQAFQFVCSRQGIFTHLKICYHLTTLPQVSKLDHLPRRCDLHEREHNCKDNSITLQDWQQSFQIQSKQNSYFEYKQQFVYYPLQSEIQKGSGLGRVYSANQVKILTDIMAVLTIVGVSALWIYGLVVYCRRCLKKGEQKESLIEKQTIRLIMKDQTINAQHQEELKEVED